MRYQRFGVNMAGLLGLVVALPASAAITLTTASGANPAAIQTAVDNFRAQLGANNGVGGTFANGRREINWDGVPDSSAAPNFLAPDFFNVTSPRGVVLNALEFETGSALNDFMVSADSSNPTSTPVEFGDIDPAYPASFQPFSSPRLFHVRNAAAMEVLFFVPGTTVPAVVQGFGVVFTDVDSNGGSAGSLMRCYSLDGRQLAAASAPVFDNGLSFLAMFATTDNDRIARCNIEIGNRRLLNGVVDGGGNDVVALDDFIYGEPRSIFSIFADNFE
ncbi:MAG: hypothetical protein JNN30_21900 [Rhodanobacteraceae bacterium]|nr:hypothetical protein [Rhodanobacteraceae bacterium]